MWRRGAETKKLSVKAEVLEKMLEKRVDNKRVVGQSILGLLWLIGGSIY